MLILYSPSQRYLVLAPLVALLLVTCHSTGTSPARTVGASSPLVSLDPEDFSCLESPVHETSVLPAKRVRNVRGMVDYDGEALAGVHLFLEPSSGRQSGAFYEVTSEDGTFLFTNIRDGKYKLRTCLEGWNVLVVELEVDKMAEDLSISLPMTLS